MAKIKGGSSKPVVVATDADLAAGRYEIKSKKAIPVHGFTTERKIEGGFSKPVYVVTQAQIDSGEYQLVGGSVAIPVSEAVSGVRLIGGDKFAQPVYVVGGALGLPDAPTGLTATQSGADVVLTWGKNAANATGYKIYRDSVLIATIGDLVTYTDTAPGGGTWYYYVSAYNGAGETASNIDTVSMPFDFTILGDGSLPAAFTGATFAVSSGVAVNTPTLGAELLTNPGLEGTYTAGLSPNLTKTGTPTVSEATGGDVHGGSSAQQFTGTAFNDRLNWPVVAGVAGNWYLYSLWAKRTAGTAANTNMIAEQTGNLPAAGAIRLFGASYTQEKVVIISTGTANIFPYPAREATGGGSYDTVIVDDGSLKILTYSTLFAMISATDRTATVKAQPDTPVDGTLSAIIAWADATTSPSTFVMAYWRIRTPKDRISFGLMKCVAGTWTNLITETSAVTVANAWLEIRPVDDDTVALYYNDVQIGTDKDVADVPGANAGFVVTGGNNVKSFFMV